MIFYVVDYNRMGPRPGAAKQINGNTNLDVVRQRSVFKEMGKEKHVSFSGKVGARHIPPKV